MKIHKKLQVFENGEQLALQWSLLQVFVEFRDRFNELSDAEKMLYQITFSCSTCVVGYQRPGIWFP